MNTARTNTLKVPREKLLETAARFIEPADVVLDIGCGLRKQDFIQARSHIVCEPYTPYLERLLAESDDAFRLVPLNCGWQEVVELLPAGSVDTVFLLDVIEHVDKDIAQRALAATEKLARKQIVIFTPLGFMEQHYEENEIDGWGMQGGTWQTHRSGWLPEEFGDNWDTVICEDFHEMDGSRKKLDEPFGAFFTIRRAPQSCSPAAKGWQHSDYFSYMSLAAHKGETPTMDEQRRRLAMIEKAVQNGETVNLELINDLASVYPTMTRLDAESKHNLRKITQELMSLKATNSDLQIQLDFSRNQFNECNETLKKAVKINKSLTKDYQDVVESRAWRLVTAVRNFARLKKVSL